MALCHGSSRLNCPHHSSRASHFFSVACPPALPACLPQYGNGDFAPGIKYGESGKWKCGHNLLLSHAKAVKVFRDGYKAKNDGRIGMALWSEWSEPWRPDNEGGACGQGVVVAGFEGGKETPRRDRSACSWVGSSGLCTRCIQGCM